MSPEGSVTRWLGPLKAGDPAAVTKLWERYFHRLVGLARLKLRSAPRRAADEEDVALSAFDSFCRNAADGRFPKLLDREGLWRLLVVVTARKASHLKRDQGRQKRGGGTAPISDTDGGIDDGQTLERILSQEPSPQMAAEMADEYRRLLESLGDAQLQEIAVARMEGRNLEEIAEKHNCAPRSIKRRLQLIRSIWEKAVDP
jgi:DNA-directed RNA polymerase specialized sigma24 family protein